MFAHKREPFQKCRKKSQIYTTATLQPENMVKSVTGQNLLCNNEMDQYFKMLATDWGDIFERQTRNTPV
uniref:Uncharacterized protein n=1 Tax=Panagrolaimus sp. PS1159 TaxID=55785 RepID=A0AC35GH69_9BILA